MSMLETIFEAREEELAFTNKTDKEFMSKDDANRSKKHSLLNEGIEKIPYDLKELKNDIIKLLEDYIKTIDYRVIIFIKNIIWQD